MVPLAIPPPALGRCIWRRLDDGDLRRANIARADQQLVRGSDGAHALGCAEWADDATSGYAVLGAQGGVLCAYGVTSRLGHATDEAADLAAHVHHVGRPRRHGDVRGAAGLTRRQIEPVPAPVDGYRGEDWVGLLGGHGQSPERVSSCELNHITAQPMCWTSGAVRGLPILDETRTNGRSAARLDGVMLTGQGLKSGLGHAPDVPARPAPDVQHIVRARGHLGLAGSTGLAERRREWVSAPVVRNGLGR